MTMCSAVIKLLFKICSSIAEHVVVNPKIFFFVSLFLTIERNLVFVVN